MVMRRFFFFFLSGLLVSVPLLQASGERCLGDVCFSETHDIGGTSLPLRGVKLFEYWMFDLYTAALYIPDDVKTVDDVLGPVPKSLVLHYHRGIKPSQMNEAAFKAMQKDPAFDEKALIERIHTIEAVYQKVKKGDRYELRYIPEKGTVLLFNGTEQVTIPGQDFAKAYFGIWLGHYPLNTELRDTLIGKD